MLLMNCAHVENMMVPCQLQKNDGGCPYLYQQAESTCHEVMTVCETHQPFIIFVLHSYGLASLPQTAPCTRTTTGEVLLFSSA